MIFRTIPNINNVEEKKQSFYKRRVDTNDAVSMSNSVAVTEYGEPDRQGA